MDRGFDRSVESRLRRQADEARPSRPRPGATAARVEVELARLDRWLGRNLRHHERRGAPADAIRERVLCHVWRRLERGDGRGGSLDALCRLAARHAAADAHRSAARRREVPLERLTGSRLAAPAEEDVRTRARLLARIRAATLELTESQRVVVLRTLDGMRPCEIAAELGLRDGTVRMRLLRAVLALKARC